MGRELRQNTPDVSFASDSSNLCCREGYFVVEHEYVTNVCTLYNHLPRVQAVSCIRCLTIALSG
ncbi:hypothetical protein J6590_076671 [Homalodisca vitripennis]|nr:hypothetical protein J6590_076671 [Homalodisca vitripennis]